MGKARGTIRDVRVQLAIGAGCLAIAAALVAIPTSIQPSAETAVVIEAPAFERLKVSGSLTGMAKVEAQLGEVTLTAEGGPSRRRDHVTELVLPVGIDDCRRLARQLEGGCAGIARGTVDGREVNVASGQPILVMVSGAASGGLRLDRAGALSTVAPGARRTTVEVGCQSPWQELELTIRGSRSTVPRACVPGDATTSLHVVVRSGAGPIVDLVDPRAMRVVVPGRTVKVIGTRPDLIVAGDETETSGIGAVTTVRADRDERVVAATELGSPGTFRVTVPNARDLHVAGTGERLPTLWDKNPQVWGGLALVFAGAALAGLIAALRGVLVR